MGEALCNSCYYTAMRTHGQCPGCGHQGVLPGRRNSTDDRPVCLHCAGVNDAVVRCRSCALEGEMYRQGHCAQCALRHDLQHLAGARIDTPECASLIEALCSVDRPESILTWKRSSAVHALLVGLLGGSIAFTHQALDDVEHTRATEHLRSILIEHGLLPVRDQYLANFERWIEAKLATLDNSDSRSDLERFTRWHHLRRIRTIAAAGKATNGPVRSAKQEITETAKFLNWLHTEHHRTAATCNQHDVDEYLAGGPTTRHHIRTFFIWARQAKLNQSIVIGHRHAATTPVLHQDQRVALIRDLIVGTVDTLQYRVAGLLLLLYAQPVSKIVTLTVDDLLLAPSDMRLRLGAEPVPVPAPFAVLIYELLEGRANLRTTTMRSSWLFPGYRAGQHINAQTCMQRLRRLGIDLRGTRNGTLRELVREVPAPILADMLGYSTQVTQNHGDLAGQTYARYASTPRSR
ncbi:hypothetical protein [Rhodococcus sp. PvP104]|uniref:hypothetical protein n=1 Tax=Rhodococcus sp. PvP104 TaxID=2817911 RepID=UPI0027DBD507|nr:hypothetical protein [Rhodococcus sp. PvP104]